MFQFTVVLTAISQPFLFFYCGLWENCFLSLEGFWLQYLEWPLEKYRQSTQSLEFSMWPNANIFLQYFFPLAISINQNVWTSLLVLLLHSFLYWQPLTFSDFSDIFTDPAGQTIERMRWPPFCTVSALNSPYVVCIERRNQVFILSVLWLGQGERCGSTRCQPRAGGGSHPKGRRHSALPGPVRTPHTAGSVSSTKQNRIE